MPFLKKTLLWSAPVAILPVAFVSSCNSKESFDPVDATIPSDSKVLDGFLLSHEKYEEAKNKQYRLIRTTNQDVVSFENDEIKFSFDKRSLEKDILNGESNAKKFVTEALSSMNITSLAHLNADGKTEILVKGIDDSSSDAGGYSPNGIVINLAKNIFAKNFGAAMKVYENVINHEWGHFETVMPINSLYGANDMGAHLDKTWRDFLNDLDGYEDFKNMANFKDQNYPWHLDDDKVMFAHPEKFFKLNDDQKNYWKNNVTDKIKNASKIDGVEAHDLSSLLAELITRLQMTYTVRYKVGDILDSSFLLPMQTRNLFANQLELAQIFNFNFYDQNNDSITLDFMKSILKNFYGVGNTSGVQVTYANGKIIAVAYDSLGMPYENIASKLLVIDKDTHKEYGIPLSHEKLPFAFDRNPFLETSREYEGTIDSSYVYDDSIAIQNISSKNFEYKLEDKTGNVIPESRIDAISTIEK